MTLKTSQMAHESHTCRTYNNDKGYFTIAEVIDAIVEFERVDRPQSEWLGGVKCNHIYLDEGLLPSTLRKVWCEPFSRGYSLDWELSDGEYSPYLFLPFLSSSL